MSQMHCSVAICAITGIPMLRSDVSMAAKSSTLWIHGIYESIIDVHGHEHYTVDPCDR
jgi:hypothetical protein